MLAEVLAAFGVTGPIGIVAEFALVLLGMKEIADMIFARFGNKDKK